MDQVAPEERALSIPEEGLAALPALSDWPDEARDAASVASSWVLDLAGVPIGELRRSALSRFEGAERPLIMGGHQPVLFGPGVWVKTFAATACAEEVGGSAVDLVVDTDEATGWGFFLPKPASPWVERFELLGGPIEGTCFCAVPAPSPDRIKAVRERALTLLSEMGLEDRAANLAAYLEGLARESAAGGPISLVAPAARRRYERGLLSYHTVCASEQGGWREFELFVASLSARAREFAAIHNEVVTKYRATFGFRSAARPFPDLGVEEDAVELPVWHVVAGRRRAVWASPRAGAVKLLAGGREVGEARGEEISLGSGSLAPKAVALTLFNRLVVADSFVHGAGGSTYDLATEAIARSFYGVTLPRFLAVTATMTLGLGSVAAARARASEASQRLHRLRHNPDRFVDEAPLGSAQRARAHALREKKRELVELIKEPGADRKALGARIEQVNREIALLLAPVAEEVQAEVAAAEEELARAEAHARRDFPYFLWTPAEMKGLLDGAHPLD